MLQQFETRKEGQPQEAALRVDGHTTESPPLILDHLMQTSLLRARHRQNAQWVTRHFDSLEASLQTLCNTFQERGRPWRARGNETRQPFRKVRNLACRGRNTLFFEPLRQNRRAPKVDIRPFARKQSEPRRAWVWVVRKPFDEQSA